MALSALRKLLLLCGLTLLLLAEASACFGPKLFIGVEPGTQGEMRYHLVAIYLHEKTGIDSVAVELKPGQTAISAIQAAEIDLGFSATESGLPAVLQLPPDLKLYSGDRPLNDLQFSTLGRVFLKLQSQIDSRSLEPIQQAIAAGTLPAAAVRDFMMKHNWI